METRSEASVALTETFKSAMATVCSPVSVVTTVVDGGPRGTTVSAFTSLSLDPPMVLVSLDRTSQLLSVLEDQARFGLNVLSSSQSADALAFARKGGAEKFEGVAWTLHAGLPRLSDASAFVVCEVESITEGGDHQIVMGRVLDAEVIDLPPLTYHRRTFGTHHPVPA